MYPFPPLPTDITSVRLSLRSSLVASRPGSLQERPRIFPARRLGTPAIHQQPPPHPLLPHSRPALPLSLPAAPTPQRFPRLVRSRTAVVPELSTEPALKQSNELSVEFSAKLSLKQPVKPFLKQPVEFAAEFAGEPSKQPAELSAEPSAILSPEHPTEQPAERPAGSGAERRGLASPGGWAPTSRQPDGLPDRAPPGGSVPERLCAEADQRGAEPGGGGCGITAQPGWSPAAAVLGWRRGLQYQRPALGTHSGRLWRLLMIRTTICETQICC